MGVAGIITAELITKLSVEGAKVLQTYMQTNSAKDMASFIEWGKAYNISANVIAEIATVAYKSDVDIIRTTNDTTKLLLAILENCFLSSDNQADRDKVFSIIEDINNSLIETQAQTMEMKKIRQKSILRTVSTGIFTVFATSGIIAGDVIFNKGKLTKSIPFKQIVKTIKKL